MSKDSSHENGKGVASYDLNLKPEVDVVPSNCCICVEPLDTKHNGRILVKLSCEHEFHFVCIGSAFNWKQKMECPICRNIEPGQWLYPSGPSNLDLVSDDNEFDDEEEEPRLDSGLVNLLSPSMYEASLAASLPRGPTFPSRGVGVIISHGLGLSALRPFGENGLGTSHGLGSSCPRHFGGNGVATNSFLPYQFHGSAASDEEWRDFVLENMMLRNEIDELSLAILADYESFSSGESSHTRGTSGESGDNSGGSICGGGESSNGRGDRCGGKSG